MTVEKKGQDSFTIPFKKSPKILISTNYTIKGSGGNSEERRKFVVEFHNYYDREMKPDKEFGHRLFDDWSNEEWNLFDNFMAGCAQLFLQEGLIEYEHVNLAVKELIGNTSEEFVEFAESLKLDKEYELKELLKQFKTVYDGYNKLSQHAFNKWLRTYIRFNGYTTYALVNGQDRDFHNRNGYQFVRILEQK